LLDSLLQEITRMFAKWRNRLSDQAIHIISKTSSALYFHILLGLYTCILLTRMTSLPQHHHDVEPGALLMYLYTVSIVYLSTVICFYASPRHSALHTKSHGSAFLRQGALVFGFGSSMYTMMEFVSAELSNGAESSSCHETLREVNALLLMVFILLQMATVIYYPRLNIRFEHGLPHFGLIHLVATNCIMWIRTVVKESLLEFHEVNDYLREELKEQHRNISHHQAKGLGHHESSSPPSDVIDVEYSCYWYLEEEYPGIYHLVEKSTPILYPFVIEFSLIGCTMFYSMWSHINHGTVVSNEERHQPSAKKYLQSLDWSHSSRGIGLGLAVTTINLINLTLFFTYSSDTDSTAEFVGKLTNTVINIGGMAACLIAITEIQKLKDKEIEGGVDSILLYISGFFLIIYSVLEIVVGVYGKKTVFSDLQILNGVFSVISTIVQVIFVNLTFAKGSVDVNSDESGSSSGATAEDRYPGRQETAFLAILNFSQWFIFTFELQKSKASRTEAKYFGAYAWILIQRITLPLSIFFRFHSTVLMVDAWKNNYKGLLVQDTDKEDTHRDIERVE